MRLAQLGHFSKCGGAGAAMRRVALAAAALANIAQVFGKVEPVPLSLSKGLCPPPDLPHRSSVVADLCCQTAGCTAFPSTCPPRCQGAYITYYEECGAQLPLDANPTFESFASACDALGPIPPPPPAKVIGGVKGELQHG